MIINGERWSLHVWPVFEYSTEKASITYIQGSGALLLTSKCGSGIPNFVDLDGVLKSELFVTGVCRVCLSRECTVNMVSYLHLRID